MPPDPEAAEPHPWRCAVTGVAAETAPRPTEPAPVPARRAGTAPAAEPPSSRPTWPASPSTSGAWRRCGTSPERVRRGSRAAERGPIQAVNQLLATLRRPPRRPWRTWSAPRAPPVATKAVGHDPAPGAQDPGARLGPGHRKIWDFYFELFGQRQSTFGVAGRLRPHRARLLPARLHAWDRRAAFRAAAVRLHADRVLAGDLPARHPTPAAGTTVEPVPAGAAALPPLVNPWTMGAISTRSATTCRTSCNWNAWSHWRSCAGSAAAASPTASGGCGPAGTARSSATCSG